jgi:Ca2+-binding RTX toxin-like protein
MATYTLTGIAVFYDNSLPNDPAVDVRSAVTMELVVPASITTLSYLVNPLPPGGTAPEDLTISTSINAQEWRLDGRTIGSEFQPEFSIYEITWSDAFGVPQNTTVLVPFFSDLVVPGLGNVGVDYVFVIGGDPMPPVNSPAEWNALGATITSLTIPMGTYGPDTPIALNNIGATVSTGPTGTTGDDVLDGTAAGETIEGLAGDDAIDGKGGDDRLFGGDGSDTIKGGTGDDFINPGDNSYWDIVDAGSGNDTITFSGLVKGYVDLRHDDLNVGITVNINANTNVGNVDKGVNGTTTIIDVANPVLSGYSSPFGGFGVWGTAFDDVFNITTNDNGWMQMYGGEGNDTFNVGVSTGSLRLSYYDANVTSGIRANLATGVVANDGWGGTDTIIGAGSISEIRGTMLKDRIIGSAGDDRFILMGGNDVVKGGKGSDLVRYDRSGVEAVTVDLGAGTATGIWRGQAFTHKLGSIENVRGSRADDDVLRGSGADNTLDGRGGNDTLVGRGGNDTLWGGDGNDILNGGSGADYMEGGNGIDTASYSSAKIKVKVDLVNGALNTGEAAGDTLLNIENLKGGKANDVLSGNAGANTIDGNKGGDRLEGRDGNDILIGGGGNDRMLGGKGSDSLSGDKGKDILLGGKGKDTLDGGGGNDKMVGGGGNDTFVFSSGNDVVTDFDAFSNRERIDLSGVSAITGFSNLKNNFLNDVAGDAVIDDGNGNTLTLNGVDIGDLNRGDFIF